MGIVVQKYGGSSLADADAIKRVARRIVEVKKAGHDVVGEITSGGFGPSLNGPCAMGYVAREHAADGTALDLMVRGKPSPARIVATPFFPHRYVR